MSSTIATSTTPRPIPDTALSRHLQQCQLARSRWFGAAMLAEELDKLVAPRFATTVVLVAAVMAVSCTWL